MADNKLVLKLTNEQQQQIRDTTGMNVKELNVSWGTGPLTEKELDGIAGGKPFGAAGVTGGLATPGCINWLVASARDAALFN